MTELIRVFFTDNSWTTVAMTPSTNAAQICAQVGRKRGFSSEELKAHALHVSDANARDVYELALNDDEIPLEYHDTFRSHGQLEHVRFIFKRRELVSAQRASVSSVTTAAGSRTSTASGGGAGAPHSRMGASTMGSSSVGSSVSSLGKAVGSADSGSMWLDDVDERDDADNSSEEELFGVESATGDEHSVEKGGFLVKRGARNTTSWRERYFVLRGTVMHYYKQRPTADTRPKQLGEFDVGDCTVCVSSLQRAEGHTFEVHTHDRIYYLVSKTAEDMHSWMKVLTAKSNLTRENDELDDLQALIDDIACARCEADDRVRAELRTLEGLMKHPAARRNFLAWMEEKHCEENFVFWTEAERYRHEISSAKRLKVARALYDRFIRSDSHEAVACDATSRSAIKRALDRRETPTDLFVPLQHEVFSHMEVGLFREYKHDPCFTIDELDVNTPLDYVPNSEYLVPRHNYRGVRHLFGQTDGDAQHNRRTSRRTPMTRQSTWDASSTNVASTAPMVDSGEPIARMLTLSEEELTLSSDFSGRGRSETLFKSNFVESSTGGSGDPTQLFAGHTRRQLSAPPPATEINAALFSGGGQSRLSVAFEADENEESDATDEDASAEVAKVIPTLGNKPATPVTSAAVPGTPSRRWKQSNIFDGGDEEEDLFAGAPASNGDDGSAKDDEHDLLAGVHLEEVDDPAIDELLGSSAGTATDTIGGATSSPSPPVDNSFIPTSSEIAKHAGTPFYKRHGAGTGGGLFGDASHDEDDSVPAADSGGLFSVPAAPDDDDEQSLFTSNSWVGKAKSSELFG